MHSAIAMQRLGAVASSGALLLFAAIALLDYGLAPVGRSGDLDL